MTTGDCPSPRIGALRIRLRCIKGREHELSTDEIKAVARIMGRDKVQPGDEDLVQALCERIEHGDS